jgi:chromosome segregation ATPase
MEPDSILVMRSNKAQLEIALLYLKRRHTELKRQLVSAERLSRAGTSQAELVVRLRSTVTDHATQIERHNLEITELDEQIQAAQSRIEKNGAEGLTAENEAVTAQIGEVRGQILDVLRQLAEPLRRYESLAEKKGQLSGQLASKTGRSQAYVDYIDGALFRQSEYVDDLRYVVEAIRRHRVVA